MKLSIDEVPKERTSAESSKKVQELSRFESRRYWLIVWGFAWQDFVHYISDPNARKDLQANS
jgi:hypothetical protein